MQQSGQSNTISSDTFQYRANVLFPYNLFDRIRVRAFGHVEKFGHDFRLADFPDRVVGPSCAVLVGKGWLGIADHAARLAAKVTKSGEQVFPSADIPCVFQQVFARAVFDAPYGVAAGGRVQRGQGGSNAAPAFAAWAKLQYTKLVEIRPERRGFVVDNDCAILGRGEMELSDHINQATCSHWRTK